MLRYSVNPQPCLVYKVGECASWLGYLFAILVELVRFLGWKAWKACFKSTISTGHDLFHDRQVGGCRSNRPVDLPYLLTVIIPSTYRNRSTIHCCYIILMIELLVKKTPIFSLFIIVSFLIQSHIEWFPRSDLFFCYISVIFEKKSNKFFFVANFSFLMLNFNFLFCKMQYL